MKMPVTIYPYTNLEWKSMQTVPDFLYSLEHMVYEVMIGTIFQLLQNKDKWENEDTKIQQSPRSLKKVLESEGTIPLIFLLVK